MTFKRPYSAGLAALAVGLFAATAAYAEPTVNKGDNAWMLTSTVLVLLMTIPGLALFYGGLVRSKNMLSVLMQVFYCVCIVTLIWALYGYSLAFTGGSDFIGGFSKAFLMGVTPDSKAATFSIDANISELVYVCFQMTFAAITPALIVGAFAERMKFAAVALFIPLWVTLIYFPIAHMVWYWAGPDALFDTVKAPSARGAAGAAACAAAALSWMFAEWIIKGHPSLLGALSGAVAGLVAVTPAAGYSGPMGAIVLGLVVGVVCLFFCTVIKNALGYDDSLDVFGVHCIGGIVGALGTGILVNPALGGAGIMDYTTGKIADYDFAAQMVSQTWGVCTTLVWSGVGSAIIYKVVDVIVGLRATVEVEREGLDITEHTERAYNM